MKKEEIRKLISDFADYINVNHLLVHPHLQVGKDSINKFLLSINESEEKCPNCTHKLNLFNNVYNCPNCNYIIIT